MKDKLAGPEELERLESEATPGPWFREGAPYYDQHRWITVNAPDGQLLAMGGPNRESVLAQDREKADASLIVALRNAAPALVAVLRAAMDVDDCEWRSGTGRYKALYEALLPFRKEDQ